nr:MAG TPA: hypothetical protein [Caudoviricetes sp.]
MSENYIVINGKRAELTKEQMEQLGIEEKKKDKRWRADGHTKYWFLDSQNRIDSDMELRQREDDFRYYSHNYFQTKEETETYARVLETEMLLKKYADEHNGEFINFKYYLLWFKTATELQIDFLTSYARRPRTIFFSSKEIIQDAIEEIGLKRIKEYLTYEW